MDETAQVATAIKDTVTNPYVIAIGGPAVTAFLMWLVRDGKPFLEWALSRWKAEKQEHRKEAQEGLLMVLENTKTALVKCEAALAKATDEVQQERKGKHDCETKLAALAVRVEFLEDRISEIQQQAGVWQRQETASRIAGDAKNAETK
jgi:hypothetical protein